MIFSFSRFVSVARLGGLRIEMQVWVEPTLFEGFYVWGYCFFECLGIIVIGRESLVDAF